MSIVIGLLTFLLVLDCLILMLLVLVQLPKKEAGLGQAFGGAATEALFGAGSGNALTKLTKYAAAFFFGFTLLLVIAKSHSARSQGGDPRQVLGKADRSSDPMASPAAVIDAKPATPASATAPGTNILLSTTIITNAVKAVTNAESPVSPPATATEKKK